MGIQPGHNGAEPPAARPPSRSDGRLERDVRELLAAIERLSGDAGSALRDEVDRRPYRSLGLGLLGGYVLGGGLTIRLGTLVLAAAGRAALASLFTRGATTERKATG
jgi:hypothetical protein